MPRKTGFQGAARTESDQERAVPGRDPRHYSTEPARLGRGCTDDYDPPSSRRPRHSRSRRREGVRSMTRRGEYWNEEIETMPAEARRRLESERLREQIAYNHRTSPFYAAKLDAAGARPSDIRCVDDLARIPFMEKHELTESQADG